ncbi:hypothetical protein [Streptomyces torulosus]|uniref:hypothetical protein n=1 Tax=Streptomyces torulosus TaxID=68276 RepID=UPI0006EB4B10|nr:hypothetical protein [Streptomyces torulosus]
MTEQPDSEPVLSRVEPLGGGPYADQPYEAALGDLRRTVGEVSAALRDAAGATREHLLGRQRELNRLQLALRPDDTDALADAHALCHRVRTGLARLPGGDA